MRATSDRLTDHDLTPALARVCPARKTETRIRNQVTLRSALRFQCISCATIARPFFCTRCKSLRALPVGRFCPPSHFCTVETLVFSSAAETAWLTRDVSRIRLINDPTNIAGELRWPVQRRAN